MKDKKQVSFRSLFDNNKFVLFLSFVLAIIFWMIITVTVSPDSENTISGVSVSIPIENSVVSELGMDVIGDINEYQAAVTVTGPAYVVSSLTTNDISVTASISNVTAAGEYALELRASKQAGSRNREFEISSVSPASINVTFDYIDTKQFTVQAQAIGAAAVEGLVAENPVVSDSNQATLTFKGSRTNIEKIDKIVAVAEVNDVLSETETFASELQIYDSQGNLLPEEHYSITGADGQTAPDVQISVPISKMKTVSLKAQFINAPKDFAKTPIKYSLSDTKIEIIGPPKTVDEIDSILLGEINFDELKENHQEFEVPIILPEGIKSVDNLSSINVTITGMEQYVVRTYTVSQLSITTNGGKATLSRHVRNVKIAGPRSVLREISSSDLYAEVNIEGLQAGEHTVATRILCKSSGKVWQVGTYTATVNVKK